MINKVRELGTLSETNENLLIISYLLMEFFFWFQNRMAAFITSAAFLVLSQCAYHTNHDFFVAGGNAVMYTYVSKLFLNCSVDVG